MCKLIDNVAFEQLQTEQISKLMIKWPHGLKPVPLLSITSAAMQLYCSFREFFFNRIIRILSLNFRWWTVIGSYYIPLFHSHFTHKPHHNKVDGKFQYFAVLYTTVYDIFISMHQEFPVFSQLKKFFHIFLLVPHIYPFFFSKILLSFLLNGTDFFLFRCCIFHFLFLLWFCDSATTSM